MMKFIDLDTPIGGEEYYVVKKSGKFFVVPTNCDLNFEGAISDDAVIVLDSSGGLERQTLVNQRRW